MAWTGLCVALVLTALASAAAHAGDPDLAPGRDPSGTAIAVLSDGFDYRRADVAAVLARDGEGEAIAWDAVDGDHRPFAGEGTGTGVATAMAARGGVRVVAVRVARGDPASLARGIAFAAGTPARIVVVPLAAAPRSGFDVIAAAARRFAPVLFIASVPNPEGAEMAQAETLANLILLDTSGDNLSAGEVVARVLGCGRGALAGASGAELKSAFLKRVAEAAPARCDEGRGQKSE